MPEKVERTERTNDNNPPPVEVVDDSSDASGEDIAEFEEEHSAEKKPEATAEIQENNQDRSAEKNSTENDSDEVEFVEDEVEDQDQHLDGNNSENKLDRQNEEEEVAEFDETKGQESEPVNPEGKVEAKKEITDGKKAEETENVNPEGKGEVKQETTDGKKDEKTENVNPEGNGEAKQETTDGKKAEETENVNPEGQGEVKPETTDGKKAEETENVNPEGQGEVNPENTDGKKAEEAEHVNSEGQAEVNPENTDGKKAEETETANPEGQGEVKPENTVEKNDERTESEPDEKSDENPDSQTDDESQEGIDQPPEADEGSQEDKNTEKIEKSPEQKEKPDEKENDHPKEKVEKEGAEKKHSAEGEEHSEREKTEAQNEVPEENTEDNTGDENEIDEENPGDEDLLEDEELSEEDLENQSEEELEINDEDQEETEEEEKQEDQAANLAKTAAVAAIASHAAERPREREPQPEETVEKESPQASASKGGAQYAASTFENTTAPIVDSVDLGDSIVTEKAEKESEGTEEDEEKDALSEGEDDDDDTQNADGDTTANDPAQNGDPNQNNVQVPPNGVNVPPPNAGQDNGSSDDPPPTPPTPPPGGPPGESSHGPNNPPIERIDSFRPLTLSVEISHMTTNHDLDEDRYDNADRDRVKGEEHALFHEFENASNVSQACAVAADMWNKKHPENPVTREHVEEYCRTHNLVWVEQRDFKTMVLVEKGSLKDNRDAIEELRDIQNEAEQTLWEDELSEVEKEVQDENEWIKKISEFPEGHDETQAYEKQKELAALEIKDDTVVMDSRLNEYAKHGVERVREVIQETHAVLDGMEQRGIELSQEVRKVTVLAARYQNIGMADPVRMSQMEINKRQFALYNTYAETIEKAGSGSVENEEKLKELRAQMSQFVRDNPGLMFRTNVGRERWIKGDVSDERKEILNQTVEQYCKNVENANPQELAMLIHQQKDSIVKMQSALEHDIQSQHSRRSAEYLLAHAEDTDIKERFGDANMRNAACAVFLHDKINAGCPNLLAETSDKKALTAQAACEKLIEEWNLAHQDKPQDAKFTKADIDQIVLAASALRIAERRQTGETATFTDEAIGNKANASVDEIVAENSRKLEEFNGLRDGKQFFAGQNAEKPKEFQSKSLEDGQPSPTAEKKQGFFSKLSDFFNRGKKNEQSGDALLKENARRGDRTPQPKWEGMESAKRPDGSGWTVIPGKHFDKYSEINKSGKWPELLKREEWQDKVVNPEEIEGVYLGDSDVEDPSRFWNMHSSQEDMKAKWMEMASNISEVKTRLDAGEPIENMLKRDDQIGQCARAYFDPNHRDPIKVVELPGGGYEFQGDGRHRVLAARMQGQEIAVKIVGFYRDENANVEKNKPENTQEALPVENGQHQSQLLEIKKTGDLKADADDLQDKETASKNKAIETFEPIDLRPVVIKSPVVRKNLEPEYKDEYGNVNWQTDKYPDGFAKDPPPQRIVLPPGRYTRYGGPTGRYLAPLGTPFDKLCLPYEYDREQDNIVILKEPIEVTAGAIQPNFGSKTGGIQYVTDKPLCSYQIDILWGGRKNDPS